MAVVNLNNVPGAVPYVSMTSDAANALLVNAINERTKQYEQQLNTIAENEALMSQMKFRDPDRPGMLVRAARIAGDLDKEIQEKYGGDYASIGAKKAVANRLAQERGLFQTAQQKYEEEQPYKQLYSQLKASGQLATKFDPTTGKTIEVNPFGQSLVDSEGNIIKDTTIDYGDIRKRGDYVDYITRNIVEPINKKVKDLGLKYGRSPFYGVATTIQGKQVGLDPESAASQVTDETARNFLKDNPIFSFEYGDDVESAKNYIKNIVRQKAIQQVDNQFGHISDPLAALKFKLSLQEKANQPSAFLPPAKERGELNPFMSERVQQGKNLQDMLKSSTGLLRKGFTDSKDAIGKLDAAINSTKADIARYEKSGKGETGALLRGSLNKMFSDRAELYKYNQEVQERKTNWFNQAAQSITGNPDAKYSKLTISQKESIRKAMPKTEIEWAKMLDDDLEGKTLTYRTLRPVTPELQKFIGTVTDLSGNYFRSSEGKGASKNIEDVAKETNISSEALREAIRSGQFPLRRLDATGEYAIRIPKDLKIGKTGKLDYSKVTDKNDVTLYYTFDEATNQMSEILRWAESAKFNTGRQQKTFDTPIGRLTLEKSKQPNIYYINGQPITKERLETNLLQVTDDYIRNTYKVNMPSKKMYQPIEDEE